MYAYSTKIRVLAFAALSWSSLILSAIVPFDFDEEVSKLGLEQKLSALSAAGISKRAVEIGNMKQDLSNNIQGLFSELTDFVDDGGDFDCDFFDTETKTYSEEIRKLGQMIEEHFLYDHELFKDLAKAKNLFHAMKQATETILDSDLQKCQGSYLVDQILRVNVGILTLDDAQARPEMNRCTSFFLKEIATLLKYARSDKVMLPELRELFNTQLKKAFGNLRALDKANYMGKTRKQCSKSPA